MIRTYSELMQISSYRERYDYLKLDRQIGIETFGYDRYLNQLLYNSKRWKEVRDKVIIRDNGCDLAIETFPIVHTIYVHHMNPLTVKDIENSSNIVYDPEFLICVCMDTHNAIHYGNDKLLQKEHVERTKNDTCPWRID